MKTFLEFIAEAEIKWNTGRIRGGKISPAVAAKEKLKDLTNKFTSNQSDTDLAGRIKILRAKVKHEDERAKERDPLPPSESSQRKNTKTSGYASKGKDVRGSVGSLHDIDSGNQPPDVRTSGRYGDTRSRSRRGGSVPTRNTGQ